MKLAHRSALLALISASFPLFVACGSNDSSSLFSAGAGSSSTTVGGSLGTGGGSAHAGHGAGGNMSNSGGSGGSVGVAGQGTGGSGTAGNNGMAGTDTGGTATGGTSAGGTSAGGTVSGGASGSGGDTTVGGGAGGSGGNFGSGGASAGTGGTGGSAGGPGASGCTPAAPVNGATCLAPTPDSCFYSGVDCNCIPQTGGGGGLFKGKWSCIGSRQPLCTLNLPITGESCSSHGGAQCPYSSSDICVCFGDFSPKWDCSGDFTCPFVPPNPGGNCDTLAVCQYPNDDCFCNGFKWVCQAG